MNKLSLMVALALGVITISSCKKEPQEQTPQPKGQYENGVFINNEGYNETTGSVSFYDRETGKVDSSIFSTVNGRTLGKWVQSITVHQDNAYICVNGNAKVEVVDRKTFKEKGTITGFSSPRYFVAVSDKKAYVSDWYTENCIAVVDLTSNTISNRVNTGNKGPEKMLLANGKVFVANVGLYNATTYQFEKDSVITVLDPATDAVVKKIYVGDEVSDLALDANGKVWAIARGSYNSYSTTDDDTEARIVRINPVSLEVEYSETVGKTGDHLSNLTISKDKSSLFFQVTSAATYTGSVYKMDVNATSAPTSAFINRSFYGMNLDTKQDLFYGTNPLDYMQNGFVLRYNAISGQLIDSFRVGVTPGGFCFND